MEYFFSAPAIGIFNQEGYHVGLHTDSLAVVANNLWHFGIW